MSQAPAIQKDNSEVLSTQFLRGPQGTEPQLPTVVTGSNEPSLLVFSPCPVYSSLPHSSFQESLPDKLPVSGSVLRGNHLRQPSLQGTFPGGGANGKGQTQKVSSRLSRGDGRGGRKRSPKSESWIIPYSAAPMKGM